MYNYLHEKLIFILQFVDNLYIHDLTRQQQIGEKVPTFNINDLKK